MSVRVRIAPAPSGSLHIGNARTALYNWLFARHHGGEFVLRIEDTDQARASEEHVRSVIDELHWLGLDYDEGPDIGGPHAPYIQSQRLDIYKGAADRLYEKGLAYRCYCTPEELKERRERALSEHRKPGYDGRCYRLTEAERRAFEEEGRRWVLRFHVGDEGETTFNDLIIGSVTWHHSDIEDFTIMRQNGFPFYVLGAAVDDAMMGITHVIRGMDLQSSTPKQILLLESLGYSTPAYAHVPLVMGSEGQKLSKRYGGGSVEWYRDHGFLPDAVVNSLVLLGTGFGDETIISRAEMVQKFSLENVHASPAAFDLDKLDWMNGEYIRMLTDSDLAEMLVPWLVGVGLIADPPSDGERARIGAVAPLVRTRIERLEQVAKYARPILGDSQPNERDVEQILGQQPHVAEQLDKSIALLRNLTEWKRDAIEEALRRVQTEMELRPKTAFAPFYVAIIGSRVGLPIFDSMEIIGREKCLERLQRARELLG